MIIYCNAFAIYIAVAIPNRSDAGTNTVVARRHDVNSVRQKGGQVRQGSRLPKFGAAREQMFHDRFQFIKWNWFCQPL
jgi:hypothetical protein